MAVLKCKMCGGDLEITEGVSVCECEYCGTKQTVPSADNEKKIALFGRANRLRFNNEFDKAAGVYESIVADFPEEAEAYWGLVLCKYGIEYVDDPASGKKIPTCHRSSFDSVMDDGNFEQVLENADTLARSVYRDEAKQIEELRKGIIEVSSKEEPYDIFICYKETAENGDRTIDSVIAQDVYDALTEKGYRVFFSRISLEDKLGVEYEPYIFAALNSAKIMLAFGTDYEYYNAVWVKNEWSRFLQLIAKGEKKTLIPCYKGIDAYDMPKEFAKLQAQDMGKVGAIQDLIRGVEKILSPQKQESRSNSITGNITVNTLLERAYILLKDGNFREADTYFDRVLDRSPKESTAYWGKLLARESCVDGRDLSLPAKIDQLYTRCVSGVSIVDCQEEDIVNRLTEALNPAYKNAVEFADETERSTYIACFDKVKTSVLGKFRAEQAKKREVLAENKRKAEEKRIEIEKRERAAKNKAHIIRTIGVTVMILFLVIMLAVVRYNLSYRHFVSFIVVQIILIAFSIVAGLFGKYGGAKWFSVFTVLICLAIDIVGAAVSFDPYDGQFSILFGTLGVGTVIISGIMSNHISS